MSVKLYAIFGILLIVAVVLITSVNDEETGTMPASPHPEMETADPLGQAPSRENVSAGVKQTMDHLRQVIAEDPQNGAAMLELATMLQNAHNPGEAAMLYERGLAISPENTDARIDYSLCLFQLGRTSEALQQNKTVIRLDPDNPKALYNIGAIYANGGSADSASFYWKRLVDTSPGDDLARQAATNLEKLSRGPEAQ